MMMVSGGTMSKKRREPCPECGGYGEVDQIYPDWGSVKATYNMGRTIVVTCGRCDGTGFDFDDDHDHACDEAWEDERFGR